MVSCQPGILAEVSPLARYLTFVIKNNKLAKSAVPALFDLVDGVNTVCGIGLSLVMALAKEIPGLGTFPASAGAGFAIPSTPAALWFWLKGTDRGELILRSRSIEQQLTPAFQLSNVVDAFKYKTGFDLTGYEDGTENPQAQAAVDAAIVQDQGAGLDGSSFVAVQLWVHDLGLFEKLPETEQDNTIGRRKFDNQEIEDAPKSAHVKRTAQESFQPEAFILRRSMPWNAEQRTGLVFVAFGKSFAAFEAILTRMTGSEDGIADALFNFTQPAAGAYFWCPPLQNGRLNLAKLGFNFLC